MAYWVTKSSILIENKIDQVFKIFSMESNTFRTERTESLLLSLNFSDPRDDQQAATFSWAAIALILAKLTLVRSSKKG
jgi:hypothetical protein